MIGWVLRSIYIAVGFLALVLGIIGAFLPLLPTTPFVLVAAYFFSKGSPLFYRKLISLPHVGPSIKKWNERGVIGRQGKVAAVVGLVAISLFLWFRPVPLWIKLLAYAIFIWVASFVASRPE